MRVSNWVLSSRFVNVLMCFMSSFCPCRLRFSYVFRPFWLRFSSALAVLLMFVMYFICTSILVTLFVLGFVVLSDFRVVLIADSRHGSLVFCCHLLSFVTRISAHGTRFRQSGH